MTFSEFSTLADQHPDGVVLLEGRRSIPDADTAQATAVARMLAERFPQLRFRSGNAEGSDTAFSAGVADINPARLQVVAPYDRHRKKARYDEAVYDSPQSISAVRERELAYKTAEASPKSKGLMNQLGKKNRASAKAVYLLRDTMKVTGHSEEFPKPIFALFYVDPADPLAGGTGHTIRVCQQEGVPYVFQKDWSLWLESPGS